MPTKDKKPSPNDYVYLARRDRDGILKIGTSADPVTRMSTLSNEYDSPMTLIAVTDGSYQLEAELHALFEKYAYNEKRSWQMVEWFYPANEILEYARVNMRDPIELARQKRLPHQLVICVKLPKPPAQPKQPRTRKKPVRVPFYLNKAPELIEAKEKIEGRKITICDIARETGIPYNAVTRLVKRRGYVLSKQEWNDAMLKYLGCTWQQLYPFDFDEYAERRKQAEDAV